MLVYPQLTTGALAQFPAQKRRGMRTIVNMLGDGSSIKLADPPGELTEWQLQYAGLSDQEALALEQFFESVEGSLNVFTFLDPTSNLFAWSDQLDHAGWTKGPLLAVTGNVADPAGGTSAWHVSNSGSGAQSLSQTLEAPGGYVYCLSLYVKTAAAGLAATLLRGSARADRTVGTEWNRITFSGSGDGQADTIDFGIELPPGGALDLYGMQVEPQAGASAYRPSTSGGVYTNAWFRDDFLALTATDVNRNSAIVNIHANRL
jgi:hypothetical protein